MESSNIKLSSFCGKILIFLLSFFFSNFWCLFLKKTSHFFLQHTHCPQIINGTLTETETEEEKEDEFEEVRKDALEGGEPPISSRDFQNKFDRVERRRKNFRQNIKKEMKEENEEDVENEIEQPDVSEL